MSLASSSSLDPADALIMPDSPEFNLDAYFSQSGDSPDTLDACKPVTGSSPNDIRQPRSPSPYSGSIPDPSSSSDVSPNRKTSVDFSLDMDHSIRDEDLDFRAFDKDMNWESGPQTEPFFPGLFGQSNSTILNNSGLDQRWNQREQALARGLQALECANDVESAGARHSAPGRPPALDSARPRETNGANGHFDHTSHRQWLKTSHRARRKRGASYEPSPPPSAEMTTHHRPAPLPTNGGNQAFVFGSSQPQPQPQSQPQPHAGHDFSSAPPERQPMQTLQHMPAHLRGPFARTGSEQQYRIPEPMSMAMPLHGPGAPIPSGQCNLWIETDPDKSRVETQLPIKIVMSGMPDGITKLILPAHTMAKPKLLAKAPPPQPSPDSLELFVSLVCSSAMEDQNLRLKALERARVAPQGYLPDPDGKDPSPQDGGEVRICESCILRERKRAGRRKSRRPAEEALWIHYEDRRVVFFNCDRVRQWEAMNAISTRHGQPSPLGDTGTKMIQAHMRIACYARHHDEKHGFNVIFTIKDWQGRFVAQAMSRRIMITDDHKSNDSKSDEANTDEPNTDEPKTQEHKKKTNSKRKQTTHSHRETVSPSHNHGALPLPPPSQHPGEEQLPTPWTTPEFEATGGDAVPSMTELPLPTRPMPTRPAVRAASPSRMGPQAKKRKPSSSGVPAALTMTRLGSSSGQKPPLNPHGFSPSMQNHMPIPSPALNTFTFPGPSHAQPQAAGGFTIGQTTLANQTIAPFGYIQRSGSIDDVVMTQAFNSAPPSNQASRAASPSGLRGGRRQGQGGQALNGANGTMSGMNGNGIVNGNGIPHGHGPMNGTNGIIPGNGALMAMAMGAAQRVGANGAATDDNMMAMSPNVAQQANRNGIAFDQISSPPPPPLPMIHKMIPNEGPMVGGIEVTVLGSGFFPGIEVWFGTLKATTTTFWGDTSMVCLLPPSAIEGLVPVMMEVHQMAVPATSGTPTLFRYVNNLEEQIIRQALQLICSRAPDQRPSAVDIARSILGQSSPNSDVSANGKGAVNGGTRSHLEAQVLQVLEIARAQESPNPVNLEEPSSTGHTMLHLACALGHHRLVAALIDMGAKVNARDHSGFTPLHFASIYNQAPIVKRLMRAGADPSMKSMLGLRAKDVVASRAVERAMRSSQRHVRTQSGGWLRSRTASASSMSSMWEPRASSQVPPERNSADFDGESLEYTSSDFEDEDIDDRTGLSMRRLSQFTRASANLSEEDEDREESDAGSEVGGIASNTTAVAAALKDQIQAQIQAQIHQLQQTVGICLQNLATLSQAGMPQMPTFPTDYQAYLPQAPFMRKVQQLVPGMTAARAEAAGDTDQTETAAPPSYDEIFPGKNMDDKVQSAARAAADAEADMKCATLYDEASTSVEASSSSSTRKVPAVLKIGRKNAITKEQQDNFLRAREQNLKRLGNDRNLFFLWIPLLLAMVCALLYSYFPSLFHFLWTSIRAAVQIGNAQLGRAFGGPLMPARAVEI